MKDLAYTVTGEVGVPIGRGMVIYISSTTNKIQIDDGNFNKPVEELAQALPLDAEVEAAKAALNWVFVGMCKCNEGPTLPGSLSGWFKPRCQKCYKFVW